MKTTKYILVAVVGALLTTMSCVQDLETMPMNPWDSTSETAYGKSRDSYVQGLARLYFNFTTNDTKDLLLSDAGASELIRSFWSCQEVSTDEVKCAWGDAWAEAINQNTYDDSENDMVYAVFVRTLQGVSYVNEYLRQTAPERLEARGVDAELKAEIQGFRAEARFLRAYFYWMAMDIFGNVPFTTEDSPVGDVLPNQKPRKEVYEFIVSELEELAGEDSAMPRAASNRPRADKGSVLGLLARVYLNAEVYTGTPAWTECKQTCEKIYALNTYQLSSNYEHLFRGDNGENPNAYNEFLFAAYYDGDKAQSWGGGTFLTCGAADSKEVLGTTNDIHEIKIDTVAYTRPKHFKPEEGDRVIYDWRERGDSAVIKTDTIYKQVSRLGIGNGWLGLHIHEKFVKDHFNPENVTWGENGSFTIKDQRAANVLLTARRTAGSFSTLANSFAQGWGCWKYNNIPHNETGLEFWERTGSPDKSTNIDYPLIRLGEIHLIYAEACCRLGQGATAQPKMNELAVRTGVEAITVPGAWDDEAMKLFRAERARELLWEGHRRTDLIRYDSYWQGSYLWPFKGGNASTGAEFPEYKKLYAIPPSQIKANTNLQNPIGY